MVKGYSCIRNSIAHIYRLDLASSPAWKSMAFHLRLDPTDEADAKMEIDYITFIKRPGMPMKIDEILR